MARSTLVLMSVCALIVGACGPSTRDDDRDGGISTEAILDSETIYVDTGEGIAAIDTASGKGRWDAPRAFPSPRFDRFFSVDGSSLVNLDPETGRARTEMTVPPGLAASVVSFDGRAVALTARTSTEAPYRPSERSSTLIVVARPNQSRYRTYRFDGNFEPEAFSTNERKLFLIEYLDLGEPPRYRVRVLNVERGTMAPVGRLTKFAPSSMRGSGRVQAYSSSGDVLYTLYTRQPPNYAHQHHGDVHHKGMVHAFIHVLNLEEGWAHCVDLPMPFGMGKEPASMLAVSPDGYRVYAGDGERVAAVDTVSLEVMSVNRTPELLKPIAGAVVASDGTLLIGNGSRVTALDGDWLEQPSSFDAPGEVRSLGIDPRGEELFVGTESGISVMDVATRKELTSIDMSAPAEIVYGVATLGP
jgi:outer membrane protein assembly factor BamB